MRLWHIRLLPVLPRQQLLGQNRECFLIESEILKKGRVNHLLVNFVNNDITSLVRYHNLVMKEMRRRGYKVTTNAQMKLIDFASKMNILDVGQVIFPYKFTHRYFLQCFHNLEEKYDCGGITESEWKKIQEVV